jgi:hypothetical protein
MGTPEADTLYYKGNIEIIGSLMIEAASISTAAVARSVMRINMLTEKRPPKIQRTPYGFPTVSGTSSLSRYESQFGMYSQTQTRATTNWVNLAVG